MFADYSGAYGEYGAYGRSLRKSISRITHAVAAPIAKVVQSVAQPIVRNVVRIAKPIVKTVVNPLANPMKSLAAIAIAPLAMAPAMLLKAKLDLNKMKRQSIGTNPDTGSEVIQYQDENGNIITEEQYNELSRQVAQEEARIQAAQAAQVTQESNIQWNRTEGAPLPDGTRDVAAMRASGRQYPKKPGSLTPSGSWTKRPEPTKRYKWLDAMIEKKMLEKKAAEQPAVTSTPVLSPVPAPSGGGGGGGRTYMPSVQMTSSTEQMKPEQSYYSQDRIPTEEGSPMQDEFRSENTEGVNYEDMDFSGYGLDIETTNLLNSEAKLNVPAAIQAGQDYVSKIQGKENTNLGAIIESPKGINAIPAWMWLALGVSVFAMVATSSKKR